LEAWKEFQRNWIYLENIFSSPDIKRNNQKDSADFENINRGWVKTMKAVV
jgi:dynein heavy chain